MNQRALVRITQLCAATVAIFGVALSARAQQAPEDNTPPPSSPPAGADVPPGEKLPPCPMPEAAAPPAPEPMPPPPVAPEHKAERKHNVIFAPQEIAVSTGAGPANYFGSALNSTIDTGAAWDARLTFGTRSVLALEAAYVGSTNNIDLQSGSHGRLNSHGIDGDLRLQVPLVVEPYIFGGVGYNHMTVSQADASSNAGPLNDSDDQLTVPAGAGFSAYLGKHTTLDARGTYRYIPDNGLTAMSSRALHQWVAAAHVGYVF